MKMNLDKAKPRPKLFSLSFKLFGAFGVLIAILLLMNTGSSQSTSETPESAQTKSSNQHLPPIQFSQNQLIQLTKTHPIQCKLVLEHSRLIESFGFIQEILTENNQRLSDVSRTRAEAFQDIIQQSNQEIQSSSKQMNLKKKFKAIQDNYENSCDEGDENCGIQNDDEFQDSKYSEIKKQLSIHEDDLEQINCFLQYYNDHQIQLEYDILKRCEFIENEYILLKNSSKKSFHNILVRFAELIDHISTQYHLDNLEQSTKTHLKIIARLFRVALSIAFDLRQAQKEGNILLESQNPLVSEISLVQNSIPMRSAVKFLASKWEKDWVKLGLAGPSHKQIAGKTSRKKAFKLIEQETITSRKTLGNQTISQINPGDQDIGNSTIATNIKTQDIEKKQPSQNKNRTNQRGQERSDDETYDEFDELMPLDRKVKNLWNSKEWRNLFNLSSNDFYSVTNKEIPKQ